MIDRLTFLDHLDINRHHVKHSHKIFYVITIATNFDSKDTILVVLGNIM